MTTEEQGVLQKIRNGNVQEFKKLYLDLQPMLFSFCKHYVKDTDVAKDLVHEVFISFWENKLNIDISVSVKSYLFKMVQNRCLNYIRSLKIHKKYTSYAKIKLAEAELLHYEAEPESLLNLSYGEIMNRYEKSMALLPEACKNIFVESRMNGLSNKEIADKYQLSVRTVENQVYRALKILKQELKDFLVVFLTFLSLIS